MTLQPAQGGQRFAPGRATTPPQAEIGVNGVVLAAALALSTLAGALFGIVPAMRVSGVVSGARQLGVNRRSRRLRSALVTFEMATATFLLAAAAMLFQNLRDLQNKDLGFASERLLSFRVSLPTTRYTDDASIARITASIAERLSALGGVRWAEPWGPSRPGEGYAETRLVPALVHYEDANEAPRARQHFIGTGALSRLRIPLLSGRPFRDSDRLVSMRVAIVSTSLAEKLWPDRDPIGQPVHGFGDEVMWTVIGVAANAQLAGRIASPRQLATPDDIYFPAAQRPLQENYFVLRTEGAVELSSIQTALGAIDPNIPIFEVATLQDILDRREGRRASLPSSWSPSP